MIELRHPVLGSVIRVRENAAKRYTNAGYVEVKPKAKSEDEPVKRPARQSTK